MIVFLFVKNPTPPVKGWISSHLSGKCADAQTLELKWSMRRALWLTNTSRHNKWCQFLLSAPSPSLLSVCSASPRPHSHCPLITITTEKCWQFTHDGQTEGNRQSLVRLSHGRHGFQKAAFSTKAENQEQVCLFVFCLSWLERSFISYRLSPNLTITTTCFTLKHAPALKFTELGLVFVP